MRTMEFSSTAPRFAEFRETLANGVLTADGAMGTMLASKLASRGAFHRRCLDELNLSLPALVRDVHQEYLRAGAQIVGTNTFGANRVRMGAFGFGDKVRAVNRAGVRIAQEAVRGCGEGRAFVAGVVGPLGVRLEPLGLTTRAESRTIFREQAEALVESGVDLLLLETFQDLDELHEAILAAREAAVPEMIVVAQVSVEDDGSLACGASTREFTRCLDQWPVDVIGLNCSSGPGVMLDTLQKMAGWTTKPLSAAPNAGLPAMVDGRTVYPCSPDYMAAVSRRFLLAGARIVGGCCGTTPEHIRRIRGAMEEGIPGLARATATVEEPGRAEAASEITPAALRSRLGAKLAAGEFVTIVELAPPRGLEISKEIAAAIEGRFAPIDCIAVSDRPAGRARMSALAACHLIQQHILIRQLGIECVLEIGGRADNVFAWQSLLLDAQALGVRNVSCRVDAAGLAATVAEMNRGQTSLLVGVAVDPSSPDGDGELRRFESQARAGVDYIVARPVFDLDILDEFLKRVEPYQLPVIAGIGVLKSSREAELLIEAHGMAVPAGYVARLREAESGSPESGGAEGHAEGLAIAGEMRERLRGRVAGIQFAFQVTGAKRSATPA